MNKAQLARQRMKMVGLVVVPAREAATTYTEILPAVERELPAAMVYSNLAEYDPRLAARRTVAFAKRIANFEAVDLVWWPDGTVVLGGEGFPVITGDAWIDEQFPPWFREAPQRAAAMRANDRAVEEVQDECLLLARFGEGTWGHWLGELLPRAVLAEFAYPGRFRFAVPAWTTAPGEPGLAASVLQSLAAYGIMEDRLIRLQAERNYRFRALASVTSVRSDRAMHPGALDLMRSRVRIDGAAFGRCLPTRVASLRTSVGRRGIDNAGAVSRALVRRGFLLLEFEDLSFAQQVCVMRASAAVFCVLGSGLTGVMYSPDQVTVIAPAPEDWTEQFFYPLVQARGGRFADIRGPITRVDPVNRRDSTFRVRMGDLRAALAAVGLE